MPPYCGKKLKRLCKNILFIIGIKKISLGYKCTQTKPADQTQFPWTICLWICLFDSSIGFIVFFSRAFIYFSVVLINPWCFFSFSWFSCFHWFFVDRFDRLFFHGLFQGLHQFVHGFHWMFLGLYQCFDGLILSSMVFFGFWVYLWLVSGVASVWSPFGVGLGSI